MEDVAVPDLMGRVALVTGASRGIGRAIALRLAAHGAAIVATSSGRSAEALEAVCSEVRDGGGQAAALTADLSDAGARAEVVSQAVAAFGTVDILVNNAAAIPAFLPPSTMPLAMRQSLFAVNLDAPLDLIQQALPTMRERGWGRILNISSDTVRQPPVPYAGKAEMVHALAVYGASKAALERVTEGLAAELHDSGVCVNALAPSRIVHTESAEGVARQMARTRPEWVEPVETMAEAAYQLIARGCTGAVISSRELLYRWQLPVLGLDGRSVMGDCMTPATR
ncbi:SDR family oxidoreductase [Algiphilus sp. NNCM1]|nr:SDR family oxidoreductase [Algiphilus acroporae]